MLTDEELLSRVKKLIEAKLNWGDGSVWTNQDFIALSQKIQQESGVSLSHVTLKRIWGKIKYDGLPQTYTQNALAVFAGFESWRDFKIKEGTALPVTEIPAGISETLKKAAPGTKNRFRVDIKILAGIFLIIPAILLFIHASKRKTETADYALSIHKVLEAGLPNSVVFDFNADKANTDSVILQQSWDTRLRTTVAKSQHQHTLIYYYPGFFNPKLIVDGQVVKEEKLLVKSDGWMIAVNASPVPVYFNKKDVIAHGKMGLPVALLKAQNILLSPEAPLLSYCNVQDFGEIYADNFTFETSLKNDYRDGSSVCQVTNIYLLCEGTAIGIPLCAQGCQSTINFFFTDFSVSGKQKDLSAFGVDFTDYVKVKVESQDGKARIYLNDRIAYEVGNDISRSKIIGIDFVFQGTGTVDYVKLFNGKVSFIDEF